jgi:hypothetical protein
MLEAATPLRSCCIHASALFLLCGRVASMPPPAHRHPWRGRPSMAERPSIRPQLRRWAAGPPPPPDSLITHSRVRQPPFAHPWAASTPESRRRHPCQIAGASMPPLWAAGRMHDTLKPQRAGAALWGESSPPAACRTSSLQGKLASKSVPW